MAWYDSESNLKSVKKYPASDKIDVTFGSDEFGDSGKVMWWDGMRAMSPFQYIPQSIMLAHLGKKIII